MRLPAHLDVDAFLPLDLFSYPSCLPPAMMHDALCREAYRAVRRGSPRGESNVRRGASFSYRDGLGILEATVRTHVGRRVDGVGSALESSSS